jgi:hypothetical protein
MKSIWSKHYSTFKNSTPFSIMNQFKDNGSSNSKQKLPSRINMSKTIQTTKTINSTNVFRTNNSESSSNSILNPKRKFSSIDFDENVQSSNSSSNESGVHSMTPASSIPSSSTSLGSSNSTVSSSDSEIESQSESNKKQKLNQVDEILSEYNSDEISSSISSTGISIKSSLIVETHSSYFSSFNTQTSNISQTPSSPIINRKSVMKSFFNLE